MATAHYYNHTVENFLVGGTFAPDDDYIVLLLSAAGVAAFDAAHTTLSQVTDTGSYEVYGNGWTQGGITIANTDFATYDSGDVILDGDDVSQAITGGSLGPFSGYVVYNGTDANDPPVVMVELDAAKTINENYLAVIEWPATGIVWFKRG